MKPVIGYYQKLVQLIETGVKGVCTNTYPAREYEVDLISLAGKANASKNPVTWSGAEHAGDLSLLLRLINGDESEIEDIDDEYYWEVLNKLVVDSFKDLSPLRDESAAKIHQRISELCHHDKHTDLLVWSRKVNKRDDGSAVITLHVSNFEDFKKVVGRVHSQGCLEDGMIVSSREML